MFGVIFMQLEAIKGIGEKTIKNLGYLGIDSLESLLTYYPYRYNDYQIRTIQEAIPNETICIMAIVITSPIVNFIKRNFNMLRFQAISNNLKIKVTIFNRGYLKNHLELGKQIILVGKYDSKKNTFTASEIKFKLNETLEPVYHLTKTIKNKEMQQVMEKALAYPYQIKSNLPIELEEKYQLPKVEHAIQLIHKPKTIEEARYAQRRFIYEELFTYMFKVLYSKENRSNVVGNEKNIDQNKLTAFINSLPFQLTEDQEKAINEALQDLKGKERMNRLILGDVGSGKTIVATILMYASVTAGYQSVLMAPTEILATQHYESITNYFNKLNLKVGILTGSMKQKEKKIIYAQLENQEIDILIGTHALLNEQVKFANLGLVVTDEQHRFGVNQRNIIQEKGNNTDILYLSATPIPRTYALTIFGDMDTSFIKGKPKGRKEIITELVRENNIKEVLLNVLEQLKLGHQVYVVAPLIEDDEESELNLNDVNLLKEKFDTAFQHKVPIGIIHGKMKNSDKDQIMNDFKENKIKILIATTVIEVGVDVKNATTMIIFNAERFGLATLHQLRGRIGRNELQSYCFLVSDKETERLSVMCDSNDGFYISEQDFKLRGGGNVFGTEQSGGVSFKIADLKRDYNILLAAKEDAEEFIKTKQYELNSYYKKIVREIEFIT